MKWNVERRLEFIESRLLWESKISRKDLVDYFDISIPQATKDFKMYQEKAPGNISYDKSAKQYIATVEFEPVYASRKSESYLSKLQIAILDEEKSMFSCGTMPTAYQLPAPGRAIQENVLKIILQCIHSGSSVAVEYQSMSNPDPSMRWISPHALGFNDLRWHVRALCHKQKQYMDLNLGRIVSTGEIRTGNFDHSNDFLWHNNISIHISPHPKLSVSQKKCVECDYNMINGVAEIEVKAAFSFYLKERLNLTQGHRGRPAKEQHIVLVNENEITTQIELLQNIEQKRLEGVSFLPTI
ncbi:MAG: WYL domain-containing protein [Deltaproteobacteria bacterium]|nr:WYL domain-containing protein [Deltaproteobacteria bacterium]